MVRTTLRIVAHVRLRSCSASTRAVGVSISTGYGQCLRPCHWTNSRPLRLWGTMKKRSGRRGRSRKQVRCHHAHALHDLPRHEVAHRHPQARARSPRFRHAQQGGAAAREKRPAGAPAHVAASQPRSDPHAALWQAMRISSPEGENYIQLAVRKGLVDLQVFSHYALTAHEV